MRTIAKLTRGGALAAAVSLVAITATACGSDPEPTVQVSSISSGTTTVKLDSSFTGQLVTLKLTPSVTGGAKLDLSAGTLTLPVSGGDLRIFKKGDVTPTVQGEIDHKDPGITFTSGSTSVALTKFVLDPGTKPRVFGDVAVDGKSTKTGIALFDLDSDSLQNPTLASGAVTLTSSTVKLDDGAATALNDAFKTSIKGGTVIGQATVQVTTGK